jgi:hypothetical protein
VCAVPMQTPAPTQTTAAFSRRPIHSTPAGSLCFSASFLLQVGSAAELSTGFQPPRLLIPFIMAMTYNRC